MKEKRIYTLGHSTHTTRELMKMLKSFSIEVLVDIRHYPGSRHCPQFGKARLKRSLERNGLEYVHMVELGGRRRPDKESEENGGWRSPQFKGYADYMQTKEFKSALKELMKLAKKKTVAIMCSEAVPWRCHRSLVGDALLAYDFEVLDIFAPKKAKAHKPIPFAHFYGNEVTYPPYEENA